MKWNVGITNVVNISQKAWFTNFRYQNSNVLNVDSLIKQNNISD